MIIRLVKDLPTGGILSMESGNSYIGKGAVDGVGADPLSTHVS